MSKPLSFLGGVERFVVKRYLLGSYDRSFSAETYSTIANVEPVFKIYIYNISKNCGFQVMFASYSTTLRDFVVPRRPRTREELNRIIIILIFLSSLFAPRREPRTDPGVSLHPSVV